MSWNYRILRHVYDDGSESFAIHEVYYEGDKPTSCTQNPTSLLDETLDDLKGSVNLICKALDQPVLDYVDFGGR